MTSPQRLYLMHLASSAVPVPGGTLDLVLGCYLVVMNDGTHILIDSGLPDDAPQVQGTPPSGQRRTVLDHLRDLGLSPRDIDVVICTHFDIDHAGYHDAFADAEFVVQRAHYELARAGNPRFAGARPHWDHPGLRYRLVDGDLELVPGVTLLETSGHTLGHQSVLVHLPETGPVLLAIDAVPMERLFTADRPVWPADEDPDRLRASTQKLLDVVERQHVALVVFGHDGRQWETLRKAPDFYP